MFSADTCLAFLQRERESLGFVFLFDLRSEESVGEAFLTALKKFQLQEASGRLLSDRVQLLIWIGSC